MENYRPGQTGLLRLSWDNGDRTILVNPELGGITLGWNLVHTAQDELFAAIEGTAFHTRIILERLAEYGVPVERVINAGGVPQNNAVLNQVYANVLGKPVLVPDGIPTSLGSGIFALLAAGAFSSVEEAQAKMCLPHKTYQPEVKAVRVYEELYQLYRKVYLAFGQRHGKGVELGDVLPKLIEIRSAVLGVDEGDLRVSGLGLLNPTHDFAQEHRRTWGTCRFRLEHWWGFATSLSGPANVGTRPISGRFVEIEGKIRGAVEMLSRLPRGLGTVLGGDGLGYA